MTFLNGYAHTISMSILIGIVFACWSNQTNCTRDTDDSIFRCLPYTYHIFHRRGFNQFCLLGRINLSNSFIYFLGIIDDGAWCIGAAKRKMRNSMTLRIKFYMIKINLTIRNYIYKPITINITEIYRGFSSCAGGTCSNSSHNILPPSLDGRSSGESITG